MRKTIKNRCFFITLKVYVEDYSWGKVKIRPVGNINTYWTNSEAVD